MGKSDKDNIILNVILALAVIAFVISVIVLGIQVKEHIELKQEREEVLEQIESKQENSSKIEKPDEGNTDKEGNEDGADPFEANTTDQSAAGESGETANDSENEDVVGNKERIVAIDPGHQGWNVDMSAQEPIAPGSSQTKAKATTGTEGTFSNLAEYQLNLDVGLKLREELENRGYKVIMTREDNDTAISNSERAKKAAEEGAEAFIRLHADGQVGGSGVTGGRAMICTPSNPYVAELYEDSKALADAVMEEYCKATGFKKLETIETDEMSGINWSQVPVIILEMGYMTNKHDDLYMADSDNQYTMAKGIADGIDKYFEGKGNPNIIGQPD